LKKVGFAGNGARSGRAAARNITRLGRDWGSTSRTVRKERWWYNDGGGWSRCDRYGDVYVYDARGRIITVVKQSSPEHKERYATRPK